MKKYILLLVVFGALVSCEKEQTTRTEQNTKLTVEVSKVKKYTSGETYNFPLKAQINIYDAEGKELELKELEGLIMGYVWDNISSEYVYADYTATDNLITFEIPQGKYFITVINVGEELPRYAYSYTTIDIQNSYSFATKIFSADCKSSEYEKW